MNDTRLSLARLRGSCAALGVWLSLLAPLVSGAGAFARSPASPYLERARFEKVREGVKALAPDLSGDTTTRTRSGR
ncbi:MAG TPA: hypothetical protein PK095_16460, partial [Myxococcota bacterium]|nr:hypothetical protein [Myxococcota bacterium]